MEALWAFLGRACIAVGLTVATMTAIFCLGQSIYNTTMSLIILCGLGVAFLGGYFLHLTES